MIEHFCNAAIASVLEKLSKCLSMPFVFFIMVQQILVQTSWRYSVKHDDNKESGNVWIVSTILLNFIEMF